MSERLDKLQAEFTAAREGDLRREFWERVFVASFAPEKPTWIGPQGTVVVDPLAMLTVSPLAVAVGAADQALVEWDKRWSAGHDGKAAKAAGGTT